MRPEGTPLGADGAGSTDASAQAQQLAFETLSQAVQGDASRFTISQLKQAQGSQQGGLGGFSALASAGGQSGSATGSQELQQQLTMLQQQAAIAQQQQLLLNQIQGQGQMPMQMLMGAAQGSQLGLAQMLSGQQAAQPEQSGGSGGGQTTALGGAQSTQQASGAAPTNQQLLAMLLQAQQAQAQQQAFINMMMSGMGGMPGMPLMPMAGVAPGGGALPALGLIPSLMQGGALGGDQLAAETPSSAARERLGEEAGAVSQELRQSHSGGDRDVLGGTRKSSKYDKEKVRPTPC